MGDLPRALGAYDRVIAIESDIHCLLRKGIVLTTLDRPEEAKRVLGRVLESRWMPGVANYWLGRNHLRLGALEQAAACVVEAKRLLPADPSTLLLGGQVAVARGFWEAAEADLTAVARIAAANEAFAGTEPLCESLFLRGRVDAHRERWASGLDDFRASGECYEVSRTNLDRQEEQIRGWGLSPDEERPLLLCNDGERERTKDRIAAASYYAAACALRTGQRELAAALANEAAKRPPYKKGAEDLLRRLVTK
jgi:tetratricopeptide (TPR) repeat protein